MEIAGIRAQVRSGDYNFTFHAIQQMAKRVILRYEVEEAVFAGEIIEEYPGHRYGPCCLIYGCTRGGRRLHIAASLGPVWIITAYEPDLDEWIDYRIRRGS